MIEAIECDLTMNFTFANQTDPLVVTMRAEVDYVKKKIYAARGTPQQMKMTSLEAIDTAELVYFIFQQDVSFITHQKRT